MPLLAAARLSLVVSLAVASPVHAQAVARVSRDVYQIRFVQGPGWAPLPFDLVNNNVIFKARINGQPATILLDNGTVKTLVDRGFATRAGITLTGPGGNAMIGHTALPTARTSNVVLELPHALTIQDYWRSI